MGHQRVSINTVHHNDACFYFELGSEREAQTHNGSPSYPGLGPYLHGAGLKRFDSLLLTL